MIGSEQSSNNRLFLVNNDEVEGIGFQRAHKAGTGPGCLNTSVKYLLWEGQSAGLNTSYCECYNLETGYVDTTQTCESK